MSKHLIVGLFVSCVSPNSISHSQWVDIVLLAQLCTLGETEAQTWAKARWDSWLYIQTRRTLQVNSYLISTHFYLF